MNNERTIIGKPVKTVFITTENDSHIKDVQDMLKNRGISGDLITISNEEAGDPEAIKVALGENEISSYNLVVTNLNTRKSVSTLLGSNEVTDEERLGTKVFTPFYGKNEFHDYKPDTNQVLKSQAGDKKLESAMERTLPIEADRIERVARNNARLIVRLLGFHTLDKIATQDLTLRTRAAFQYGQDKMREMVLLAEETENFQDFFDVAVQTLIDSRYLCSDRVLINAICLPEKRMGVISFNEKAEGERGEYEKANPKGVDEVDGVKKLRYEYGSWWESRVLIIHEDGRFTSTTVLDKKWLEPNLDSPRFHDESEYDAKPRTVTNFEVNEDKSQAIIEYTLPTGEKEVITATNLDKVTICNDGSTYD